jgi:hypothetical protein
MADEDVAHLLDLRAAVEKRLKQNKITRATMGTQTPPHIAVEIQTQELEIQQLDSQLLLLHVSPEITAATGPDAGLGVVRLQLKQVGDRLTGAIAWTQKEFSREREETRNTLRWQSEQIIEAQSVARATRLEAREIRDELRETLQEIRTESILWRDQQEKKHDAGAKLYRDTLKLLTVAVVLLAVAVAYLVMTL